MKTETIKKLIYLKYQMDGLEGVDDLLMRSQIPFVSEIKSFFTIYFIKKDWEQKAEFLCNAPIDELHFDYPTTECGGNMIPRAISYIFFETEFDYSNELKELEDKLKHQDYLTEYFVKVIRCLKIELILEDF